MNQAATPRMQDHARTAGDLETLSRKLVRARWIAAAAAPPVVFVCWAVVGLYMNLWGMGVVAGLLLLTNLAVPTYARRRLGPGLDPGVRAIRLERLVRLQVAADVTALTLAFYYMGGIENALPFLGTFHVACVALHMGGREARMVALGILTGAGIIVMLEFNRALYHWHLMNDWRWYSEREPGYVFAYVAVLAVVLFLTAWAADRRTT
ncbi:MAG: hypothetical protein JRG91_08270 [Deltaproteobacteria bacterium]|nr:hypothetical protein [Deltaproteobacteria bacterium]